MSLTRPRRRRRVGRALALALVVVVLAAIGYAVWSAPQGGPGPAAQRSAGDGTQPSAGDGECVPAAVDGIPRQPHDERPLPGPAQSRAALTALLVAPRAGGATFCRGRFGPDTWPDLDRNGCTTRQDVLVRQAVSVTTRRIAVHDGTCEEAVAGTWIDPYTGSTLTFSNLKDPAQAQRLQIDHVVSLYDAWVSGARDWTDEQRVIFANDLAAPELRAVSGDTNFAKGRAGPETWSPAPDRRCEVARAIVEVKSHYRLTVTAAERDALSAMLSTCS